MLIEMSAVGTPVVAFKHQSSRLPSGEVVHRKAKQTEDFLVRNQFARCMLPAGRVETRVVVYDPVRVKHSKTADAVAEVLTEDWKIGRQ